MAHKASDGSMWTNASQARARSVPGRAQGDGKQPVSRFSKPEARRSSTAPISGDDDMDPSQVVEEHGPAQSVEINHQDGHAVMSTHSDGHKHHSKHGSAMEAHDAARTLSGAGQDDMSEGNPAQAMM